jgi:DNA-binding PadR family transcriptional regulator
MRVRDALLVLLARGPAHGYQLKLDYERLTRGAAVNVGQIYQTLDRLERDGLAERTGDDGGDGRRIVFRATEAGRSDALELVFDADEQPAPVPSSIAVKVLLAMELPGVDPVRVIDAHRMALIERVRATRRLMRGREHEMSARLGIEASLAMAEAELRWLDLCDAELQGGR